LPAAARTAFACLGKGELKSKLSFKVAGVSAGARQAIEGAGRLGRTDRGRAGRREGRRQEGHRQGGRKGSGGGQGGRLNRPGAAERLTSPNRSLYQAAGGHSVIRRRSHF
jgi:hypothetical protein